MKFSPEDLELIRSSELFDAKWYVEQYPDVGRLGMDPAEHFLWLGKQLKRSPSPRFHMRDYLEANPDIAGASVHPLVHYEKSRKSEDRHVGAAPERYRPPPVRPTSSGTLSDGCSMRSGQLNAATTSEIQDRSNINGKYFSLARASACKRDIARRKNGWNFEAEKKFLERILALPLNVTQETVSIIMPTRNRAACIGAAIESVVRQDHRNWELIIIDDGGTDDTARVIRSFNDKRIKFLPNRAGAGVSSARNFGMRAAQGKWIFFLDSDNQWRPHFLTTMLRFLQAHDLETAYAGANLLDDSGQSWAVLFSEFDLETCLADNFIDLNGFCVRRSLVGAGFDEAIRRLVDWDFILRVAAKTRLLGAPFIGVEYYDGSRHGRITHSEYRKGVELHDLLSHIRERAKSYILNVERQADIGINARIAVVLHIHHNPVVDEYIKYIRNIDRPFDLYLTTSHDLGDPVIESIRSQFNDAIILRYPDIGNDIGPFMELVSTLCNYDLVCKIHTNHDVYRWTGHAWRYALQALLGSRNIVNNIIESFRNDPNVLASGPSEFYKSGEVNSTSSTMYHISRLARETGLTSHLAKHWGFFAGAMFWMRPQILLRLARHVCDTPCYNEPVGQDGGPEHGLERLLGVCLLENANAKVALTKIDIGSGVEIEVVPARDGHDAEGVDRSLDRIAADFDRHGAEPGRPWLDVVHRGSVSSRKQAEANCLVTVFICNQNAFIGRAIESALAQNRDFGYEILILDDGSMDGARDVVEQYRVRYPDFIRSIGDGVNRGISGNFKRGLEQARGKYIAVLEGDDYWTDPDKTRKQKDFLESHESHAMVFSKILIHDLQRDIKSALPCQDNIAGDTLTGVDFLNDPNMNPIANLSCCMFRTEAMRDAPDLICENRGNEVGMAFYHEKIGPIGFIKDIMSVYVKHAQSVWTGGDCKVN